MEKVLNIEDLGDMAAEIVREDVEVPTAGSDGEEHLTEFMWHENRGNALAVSKLLLQRQFSVRCVSLGPFQKLQGRLWSHRIDGMARTSITTFVGSTPDA